MILATQTQYEALDALVQRGTMKEAAAMLDISQHALERRLQKLRRRTGLTTFQLAHRMGQGRVLVQDMFWVTEAA